MAPAVKANTPLKTAGIREIIEKPKESGRQFGSHRAVALYYCQNSMVLSAAIFITLIGLIIYLHFVKIDQESLLVIGSPRLSTMKDVVINEAIHMQKVIYYLCILLQDPDDPQGVSEVVPLFQSSKPRLDCLIEVYRSCQEILEQRKTAPQ
ncbi:PREDICTED: phosphatidylinositol N-acetylglucosaminyltransferase subunit H [Corvus brachyrhynchos]|nr:PREDICTED: phosphatidylinositol N-acetylglucosaminyltransferase subunit H [Corvus brachyrhynchos]